MTQSNFGYILAGAVIERLTGQTFEDSIRTRLFEPLGMRHGAFLGEPAPGPSEAAWPHTKRGRPITAAAVGNNDPPVLRPAGCLCCSLRDWSRFIREHLVGENGGSKLLRAESSRQLHQPRGDDYGLGWVVLERDWGGGPVLHHAGSNGWNYANVWIAPRQGFAVFVCANQGDSFQATDKAVERLIELQAARSDAATDEVTVPGSVQSLSEESEARHILRYRERSPDQASPAGILASCW